MHLRPSPHFFLGSRFLIHQQQHSKYNFLCFFFISKIKLFKQSSCFLLLNITLASLICCNMSSLFFPSSICSIKHIFPHAKCKYCG
jgi:hypothetical protein